MNIVIIGAGGHGKVVADILQHDPEVKIAGFIDDDKNMLGQLIDGCRVLGNFASLPELTAGYKLDGAVIAIGDNKVRARLYEELEKTGLKHKSAIHTHALIAKDVDIGSGVVIASGAVISTGTRVGNNVIINTGVVIDHDNYIEDHTHISPGVKLAGRVTVGKYTHVGLGVTIIEDISIGENCVIGAGAVVVADVPANATAVGVPARVIKFKERSADGKHH
jgi:sugar O-acyltransferase (sialic acid O-acetyltransferase NeuD family)